jgi:hypothetical protein
MRKDENKGEELRREKRERKMEWRRLREGRRNARIREIGRKLRGKKISMGGDGDGFEF